MELRQLEYFVAVTEEQTFTRAAERVHISQSGVSAQIRQLERELGTDLFDRSTRTATLTTAGKAALEPARAALAAAAALRQAVDAVTGLLRGRLTVAMVTGCTVTPLFDALAAFHQAHPGVEILLLEGASDQLVHQVRAGQADLALVGCATTTPDGLEALTITCDQLVAAVPPGHALARQRHVTLADLAAHPIACMPPGTGLRTVFDQACAAHGVTPRITLQASAADAIADLATRGLAIGILSTSMAAAYRDRLTALTLDAGTPALLALIWKNTPNPAVREFLTHSRDAFSAPRPA
ncbi:LysR family transcriptional regulator [Parafrankia elaeagni]|uniref:LysR family transcriptional regulator n=1 Tax=Parafrankia elaeagni TaxID=222534 RepID=UPI000477FFBC|nr:LysR family transcriptional regulator [Parafrankia elaeagni]